MHPAADALDLALARAAHARLLAMAWRTPRADWHAALLTQLPGLPACLETLDRDASRVPDLLAAAASLPDLARQHAAVVGHTVRAAATPYETEWTGWAGQPQQYHQISDIAAFYRAFGLELRACGERADHLAVELEFCAFLALKEAYARENGDAALERLAAEGARRFWELHLARWAPSFCRRVQRLAAAGFYAELARCTADFLRDECARLELAGADGDLPLLPMDPSVSESCFSCAGAPACAEAAPRS